MEKSNMATITRDDSVNLVHCLNRYQNWIIETVQVPVRKTLNVQPAEFRHLFESLDTLKDILQGTDHPIPVMMFEEIQRRYLKAAVVHVIHAETEVQEAKSELTHNRKLIEDFESDVDKFRRLSTRKWFKQTTEYRAPKLTDFVTIEQAERIVVQKTKINFEPRIFDDKFHILHPPSLFKSDLKYYRVTCGLRSAPVAIAYLDIDNFKTFNTEFGELEVDRDLLPVFMGALEAHLYARGHGYKFGGDEYVVLLPNCSGEAAKILLADFQKKLTEIDYFGIDKNPTVSIGIFEISDNCSFTDQESLENAVRAKNKVKKLNGKGDIIIEDAGRPTLASE